MKSVKLFFLLCSVCVAFGSVKAQGVSVSAGADVVSSTFGVVPMLDLLQHNLPFLSAGGLDLGIWGSSSFEGTWRELTSMPHIQ